MMKRNNDGRTYDDSIKTVNKQLTEQQAWKLMYGRTK